MTSRSPSKSRSPRGAPSSETSGAENRHRIRSSERAIEPLPLWSHEPAAKDTLPPGVSQARAKSRIGLGGGHASRETRTLRLPSLRESRSGSIPRPKLHAGCLTNPSVSVASCFAQSHNHCNAPGSRRSLGSCGGGSLSHRSIISSAWYQGLLSAICSRANEWAYGLRARHQTENARRARLICPAPLSHSSAPGNSRLESSSDLPLSPHGRRDTCLLSPKS